MFIMAILLMVSLAAPTISWGIIPFTQEDLEDSLDANNDVYHLNGRVIDEVYDGEYRIDGVEEGEVWTYGLTIDREVHLGDRVKLLFRSKLPEDGVLDLHANPLLVTGEDGMLITHGGFAEGDSVYIGSPFDWDEEEDWQYSYWTGLIIENGGSCDLTGTMLMKYNWNYYNGNPVNWVLTLTDGDLQTDRSSVFCCSVNYGVYLNNSSATEIIFQYSKFSTMRNGISCDWNVAVRRGAVTFEDCEFFNDGGHGWQNMDDQPANGLLISTLNECDVTVTYCHFDVLDIGMSIITNIENDQVVVEGNRIETSPNDLRLVSNQGRGIICSGDEGEIEIVRNFIYPFWRGITTLGDGTVNIHNNIIGGTAPEPAAGTGQGIYCGSTSSPRIYNNAIFDCDGHLIEVGGGTNPSIVFNTLVGAGLEYYTSEDDDDRRSCIFIDKDEEGNEQVFNNVFAKWSGYAVEYDGEPENLENINFNLYSTNLFAHENIEEIGGEDFVVPPWESQGYLSPGVLLADDGPEDVVIKRWGNDLGASNPDYNPFGEGVNFEHDDIAVHLVQIGDFSDPWDIDQYDFHLWADNPGDPLEINSCTAPAWVNEGRNLEGDWWVGKDEDQGFNARWNDRIARRIPDDPDMGMYAGPWANDFSWIPITYDEVMLYNMTFNVLNYLGNEYNNPDPNDFYFASENIVIPPPSRDYIGGSLLAMSPGKSVTVEGGFIAEDLFVACYDSTQSWGGIIFDDPTDVDSCRLISCTIFGADYGVYLNGVDDALGARVAIDSCSFDSCGVGIYSNNSRVEVSNCTIINSNAATMYGAGIYLTNTTAGQVIIDGNTITDNGTDETYASAGIYLNSSDPEIINNTIEDNSGGGIACYGSSPDLDTYDSMGNQPNQIASNGGPIQSGSDGAEIYLTNYSSPSVKYNNIFDRDENPFTQYGYCVYIDDYNYMGCDAKYDYWGTEDADIYASSLFREPTGYYVYYSPWEDSAYTIDNAEQFEIAMGLWDDGEFASAARLLRECVYDSGSVGVNSVHYLTGCVGEMENGRFDLLREFFLEVADDHRDARVARVAERFATHCFTEQRLYEDAMGEYDERRINAVCRRDSIMALIDYLAVEELYNGDRINALGRDIPSQISSLMRLLDEEADSDNGLLPETYIASEAYPNPL